MIAAFRYSLYLRSWNRACAKNRRRVLAVSLPRRFGRFVGRHRGGRP